MACGVIRSSKGLGAVVVIVSMAALAPWSFVSVSPSAPRANLKGSSVIEIKTGSGAANPHMVRGTNGSSMGIVALAVASMATLTVARRKSKGISSIKVKRDAVFNIQEADDFVAIKVDTPTPPSHREFMSDHAGSGASTGIRFRQNFKEQPEHLLNQQVQMELTASHAYQAMAAYFDRADVALPGFKEWASNQSEEEREHAEKFIEYINLRGGRYVPLDIPEPVTTEFSSALGAMEEALKMEINVNHSLLDIHKVASDAADAQLCDFLESEFLEEQVESISEIAHTMRKLTRAGPGLGEYEVDKDLH